MTLAEPVSSGAPSALLMSVGSPTGGSCSGGPPAADGAGSPERGRISRVNSQRLVHEFARVGIHEETGRL
jgi:hypothetical protein